MKRKCKHFRNFFGLKTKTIFYIRLMSENVYNEHIIIKVTLTWGRLDKGR